MDIQVIKNNIKSDFLSSFSIFLLSNLVLVSICFMLSYQPVNATVTDVVIADVTPHSFSVVWASDEAVLDATVQVFSDQAGLNEITAFLNITLVSGAFPPALNQGIVKIVVVGVDPDTSLFIQTETTSASGVVLFPNVGPLLTLQTPLLTRKADASNVPITNDLLVHGITHPTQAQDALLTQGTLLLIKAPTVSQYRAIGLKFPQ